jgi:hypothetical protein
VNECRAVSGSEKQRISLLGAINSAAMGTLGPFSLFLLFALSQQNVFVAASDVLELGNSDFDYTVEEYETWWSSSLMN